MLILDSKQWNEFCKLLDRKPIFIPVLHNLLTDPSIFIDDTDYKI